MPWGLDGTVWECRVTPPERRAQIYVLELGPQGKIVTDAEAEGPGLWSCDEDATLWLMLQDLNPAEKRRWAGRDKKGTTAACDMVTALYRLLGVQLAWFEREHDGVPQKVQIRSGTRLDGEVV